MARVSPEGLVRLVTPEGLVVRVFLEGLARPEIPEGPVARVFPEGLVAPAFLEGPVRPVTLANPEALGFRRSRRNQRVSEPV